MFVISSGKIKNNHTLTPNSIQIENLMERPPYVIGTEAVAAIRKDLQGKTILVTGAAGSIGSEIVRQLAHFEPKKLLLCDMAETPIFELAEEMKHAFPEIIVQPLVCDVRNEHRMNKVFSRFRPEHIYHAAAYKHVPMMEIYASEAVLANVFGTRNLVDMAIRYHSEVFVLISTDKAVNPTSVMGATKRIAERYVQSLHTRSRQEGHKVPRLIITRFGNVMGSGGSVIPTFEQQIERGGPVTVTHRNITRYFMSLREACLLVLEAANMGKGGETFVFDMGEPVKILDLAKKMIDRSGRASDIEIVFTGLRPGEKLFEEVVLDDERLKPTSHKRIKVVNKRKADPLIFNEDIYMLYRHSACAEDRNVMEDIRQLVPEFARKKR